MKDNKRIMISPLAKVIAKKEGIDYKSINHSGKRITAKDILNAKDSHVLGSGSSSRANILGYKIEKSEKSIPLSSIQKVVAQRLLESKQNLPHFYLQITCDIDSMLQMRSRLNKKLEQSGKKISVNDMFVCGVSRALAQNPEVNSYWGEDKIVRHTSVDISVAVSLPDGLITPILTDAQNKSLIDISVELKDLIKRAREKKLLPQEFQGGTFSVSNLGMFGIDSFMPVINAPQAGIASIGNSTVRPVWNEAKMIFEPRNCVEVCLAGDHRVFNGDQGAIFLANLKEIMESPELLLV